MQIVVLFKELQQFADLELSAVLLNKSRLAHELVALGIPVTIYDEAQLNAWQILRALRAYFRRWAPDVIHTHRYKENILGGIAARGTEASVVIQTVHGLQERLRGLEWAKVEFYGWINALVTRWTAHSLIGVSEEIAQGIRHRYPRMDVTCIANGIDSSAVRPSLPAREKRWELGIPQDAVVLGTVSRLTPVKGIAYLLKAVAAIGVDAEGIAMRLVIVGDGPLRSKLEELAEALGIKEATHFLGMRTDVYDLMNTCDIYILPSLHEGLPMALLEAMALGRPVIASRVGGIPGVVEDGVTGRLVPAQDVEALGMAVKELVRSPLWRERLGQAGKEHVTQTYSAYNMATKVRDVYRRAVAQALR